MPYSTRKDNRVAIGGVGDAVAISHAVGDQTARVAASKGLGALVSRFVTLLAGLFCFSAGIVLTLRSGLGLGPWDVLHQGLARHLPMSFGVASILVGFVVLVSAWALGQRPGIGTVLNMLLVGAFIDLINWTGIVPSFGDRHWAIRLLVDMIGVALVGLGSAWYIKAQLGAGPRDGLMLVLARQLGGRVGAARAALELSVLVVGYLLGGAVGIGTLVFALGAGPAVGLSFRLLRVPAARAH